MATKASEASNLGVDVNQENDDGWTPVYMAAYNGHAKALGALIAGGCDVDRPNKLGWTPACIAAQHGHLEAPSAGVPWLLVFFETANPRPTDVFRSSSRSSAPAAT